MDSPEIDQLLFVDANEALRRHFDGLNYRRAKLFWLVLLVISLVVSLVHLTEGAWFVGGAAVASFIVLAALVPLRRRPQFRRSFATLLFTLFALEALLWLLLAGDEALAVAFSMLVVAPALLFLRLALYEQWTVAAAVVGAVALRWIALAPLADGEARGSLPSTVAVGIVVSIAAGVGSSITSRARQEFLRQWRLSASRERERLRMREEIHDARAIQLAMLPAAAPQAIGLDVAGVCVPATEVGGDYYDYFPDGEGSLAVAIGDVAGHGVASGLVLAGVRAGLHLLAPEIAADPASVLTRLNGIVAGPGGQRLLMTLGLARFDRARGLATWVAAGHPPPLRWDATEGRAESPTTEHPPLGTKLPIRLEVVERGFREGDVWLLVSDGAIEARDARGVEFGERELERTFARLAAHEASASAILDGLLGELSRFRGGQPQDDDLTLVVVRAAPAT
ncbi:MAG: PP2C family protein-serine/threonine phosphatase [Thermoanaerobaculia bacterium]|nr:PP2C family protein-serine/threonine phosphatase [Thermoanaerobaculia bacterium]